MLRLFVDVMIPESFLQDLLNRLDIVDVVESYMPLKRAGANLVACCPFHSEKSPSFTVSPAKQFYHCFGCGAHGNAVGFVMEYSGLGFVEAVKELAGRAGMTVQDVRPESAAASSSAVPIQSIVGTLRTATIFYKGELKRSDAAVEYLKGRGLTGEIAARFGLGFAPPGWQSLAGAFPDYRAQTLVDAGLVVEGDDGKRYDRFRDRIMFPIVSTRGDVIGFGGRVLGKGEPKYLNSPETSVFEKGREVYGLYQARTAIRASGRVIVVEGYMDVVALAQQGIDDAVATLGTATTPFHVQKLLRQAGRVVFCFDGDEAGRRAAWRALENCLGQLVDGKEVAFAFLSEGEDPDSYVRKAGCERFEALIRDALPLSGFLLRELTRPLDLASAEGRAHLLQSAKPLIARITAPALATMLRQRLAELAGLAQVESDALLGVKSALGSRPPRRVTHPAPVSQKRQLLRCLLIAPHLAAEIDREVIDARDPDTQALLALLDFLAANPQVTERVLLATMSEFFRGSSHEPVLNEASAEIMELGIDGSGAKAEFDALLQQLRKSRRTNRLKELAAKGLAVLTPDERSELRNRPAERSAATGGQTLTSKPVID